MAVCFYTPIFREYIQDYTVERKSTTSEEIERNVLSLSWSRLDSCPVQLAHLLSPSHSFHQKGHPKLAPGGLTM